MLSLPLPWEEERLFVVDSRLKEKHISANRKKIKKMEGEEILVKYYRKHPEKGKKKERHSNCNKIV